MRRHLARLLFTGLLVLGGLVHADQVPKLIGFQGILRDSVGGLVNGTYNLTFTIYTASSAGTSKWAETQNSVVVTSGALSVTLGSVTPIPDSVFNNDTRWLAIKINSFSELTQRIRFLSVGYALRVNTVNGANGGAISGSTAIGTSNIYTGTDAFAAGNSDTASGNYSFAAGYGNKANGLESFVAGGISNIASGQQSIVLGGNGNVATGFQAAAGGVGDSSFGTCSYAFGNVNAAVGSYSVVTGGGHNRATNTGSFVGGGYFDTTSGDAAAVVAGVSNSATTSYSFIGGGYENRTTGDYAAIGGGYQQRASGVYSFIGGGSNDTASGQYATVPGGIMNTASGNHSFAAGYRAKANHTGAFVWADSSTNGNFASSANNQFNVRAAGGTRIYSNSALSAGVTLAAGGGSWASVSDSTLKRNAREVNGTELLEKLDKLPIKQWSYKSQDPNIEHIGPMAQDFYSVFQVGDNNTTISTIDPAGIALAATKELHQLYKQLAETTESLKTRTAELETVKAQLAELQKTVQQLVQASGGTAASKYGMVDQSTTNAHR